ncbi:venom serine protease Bi-VSP isoform X1 [Drosophila grimshawi]|uniref:CLIP domain-containing serine protease n=1 Tax=Drosophila grimshawi TaxID=7222 RepID=B4J1E5_DROGR|nr:venom serine protease Bi-VSP isoform X1 [Drosophila grimshawi]EDV95836.1 GH15923 [Drosophila grimshawi]
MKLVISVVLTIACLATPMPAQFNRRQVRQDCITPENYYGSCVGLSYCPQASNVFQLTDRRTAQNYVIALQRSCGTRNINGDPVVCCTRPITNQNPVTVRPTQPVTERPPNPFFPTQSTFVTPQVQPFTTQAPTGNPWIQYTTQRPTIRTTTAPVTSNSIVERGPSCRFPPGRLGECVDIKSCPSVFNELKVRQTDAAFAKELQASNLVCGRVGSNVCCPTGQTVTTSQPVTAANLEEVPRRLPTVEEGCGSTPKATFKKVVGGEPAKQGAWPWIALLGYDDGSSSPFKCGGTLITARHIITAAHCIRDDLTFVRLGEHDLTTDAEARHVDIPIAKKVRYPQYTPRNGRGDIAMLYLDRNVQFTDTIIPICMPSSSTLRTKSYVSTNPFVAGWGKTQENGKSSSVLMQLMIPVLTNEVCRTQYAKVNRYFNEEQFDKAVLCAGVLSGGKDTCQGDSGGPLMSSEVFNNQIRFYLIGVVSYGVGCARAEIPGVYASTQYFMDWILEMLLDTP